MTSGKPATNIGDNNNKDLTKLIEIKPKNKSIFLSKLKEVLWVFSSELHSCLEMMVLQKVNWNEMAC